MFTGLVVRRLFSTVVRKRFYKNVQLEKHDGLFEICLDGKAVKTPKGTVFRLENEPLAIAIAQEWDCQKDVIRPNRMFLTGLAMTALDNPTSHTKERFVQEIMDVFETDTIFFTAGDADSLKKLQEANWGALIKWAKAEIGVDVTPSTSIATPVISDESRRRMQRFLSVYNLWALRGVGFSVDSLKSVLVTLAAIKGRVTVEEAVKLAALEQEFQTQRWGRVEWAHDIEFYDSCARVAAAVLFVHLNSTSVEKTK